MVKRERDVASRAVSRPSGIGALDPAALPGPVGLADELCNDPLEAAFADGLHNAGSSTKRGRDAPVSKVVPPLSGGLHRR